MNPVRAIAAIVVFLLVLIIVAGHVGHRHRFAHLARDASGHVYCHRRSHGGTDYYEYIFDGSPYTAPTSSSSSDGRISLPAGGSWIRATSAPLNEKELPEEVEVEDNEPSETVVSEQDAQAEGAESAEADSGDSSGDSGGDGGGGDGGGGGGGD